MAWFSSNNRIFLDYASATPVLPQVKTMMDKFWSENFYNPSAIYKEGVKVKEIIEEVRTRIARILGVTHKNIIFTASGTESDNLAILGIFEKACEEVKKPHVIISSIEHSAIQAAADEIVRRGGEVSIVPVNEEGLVSIEALRKLLKKSTVLVSIGLANGEIGTVQPISKISRIVREFKKRNETIYPYLHTDASQAPSYLNVNIEHLGVDLITLDGSKIYGPKGVGILALRGGVEIHPIIFGGSQEKNLRAGTPNPSLITGFTLALETVTKDREKESTRLESLRSYFIDEVTKNILESVINGSATNHLPNILSISLPNTLSEFVVLKLDKENVLASVGSACSYDERISGSPVIRAIGKPKLAESTVRFSFGRGTTDKDIKEAVKIFCNVSQNVLK